MRALDNPSIISRIPHQIQLVLVSLSSRIDVISCLPPPSSNGWLRGGMDCNPLLGVPAVPPPPPFPTPLLPPPPPPPPGASPSASGGESFIISFCSGDDGIGELESLL
jgi:hypothetical protein